MRRAALAALLALGLAAGCSSGQDPGIDQQIQTDSTRAGSTSTPALLEACPPGGPDSTTPAAGCLDEQGNVVRP